MSSSLFIVELARARALPQVWRSMAGEWARFGQEPQARILQVVAEDLSAVLQPILEVSVGLKAASSLTGVSTRQLPRDFPVNAPGNVGRRHKPELVLGALVDRYALDIRAVERTVHLERAA